MLGFVITVKTIALSIWFGALQIMGGTVGEYRSANRVDVVRKASFGDYLIIDVHRGTVWERKPGVTPDHAIFLLVDLGNRVVERYVPVDRIDCLRQVDIEHVWFWQHDDCKSPQGYWRFYFEIAHLEWTILGLLVEY
jgi:hypothetical protein